MMSIGRKLKKLMEIKDISSDELAKCLNFSKSIIWSYELDKKEPSIEHLKKLAKFFNVTIDYLVSQDSKIPLNLINKELLKSYSILIDQEEINYNELAEAVVYLKTKRIMKEKGLI